MDGAESSDSLFHAFVGVGAQRDLGQFGIIYDRDDFHSYNQSGQYGFGLVRMGLFALLTGLLFILRAV